MDIAIAILILAVSQYVLWTKNVPELTEAWRKLRHWKAVAHLENCLEEDDDNPT